MKKFVYQVAGLEFVDTEAFGVAWKLAKAAASQFHVPVFRLVIKGEQVRQEVYYKAGCFNSIKFATKENVKIF
jgi:hypothetical protein